MELLCCASFLNTISKVLASLRDTSQAIARLERVVAGDVGVDSAERLATEINQVQSDINTRAATTVDIIDQLLTTFKICFGLLN